MNNQNPSLKDLFLKALTMKYVEQRELTTDTYMMNFYPIIEQGQNTFGDKKINLVFIKDVRKKIYQIN